MQTHSELAETRAELEQLADDILAIKMLMDEESALGVTPAGVYCSGQAAVGRLYLFPARPLRCSD